MPPGFLGCGLVVNEPLYFVFLLLVLPFHWVFWEFPVFPTKRILLCDDIEVLLFLLTYISCKKSLFKVRLGDLSPRGRTPCLRISGLHLVAWNPRSPCSPTPQGSHPGRSLRPFLVILGTIVMDSAVYLISSCSAKKSANSDPLWIFM